MAEIEEILNFWFKECRPEQWFKKNEDFDQMIEKPTVESAPSDLAIIARYILDNLQRKSFSPKKSPK